MTTLTARQHYAATYYTSIWSQDRTRAIFAGMSASEQRLHHKRAEWRAAEDAWKCAMQRHDQAAEAHWNGVMDTLNAEIDALEARRKA